MKNGTLTPLLTGSANPRDQSPVTVDPSLEDRDAAETYTILITFPRKVPTSSSVPRIEEIYLDEDERIFNAVSQSRVSSAAVSTGSPAERRALPGRMSQPNPVLSMTLQQAQNSNKSANNPANKPKANQNLYKKRRVEKKQDKKAAKTLSAILFAFIITWTPCKHENNRFFKIFVSIKLNLSFIVNCQFNKISTIQKNQKNAAYEEM